MLLMGFLLKFCLIVCVDVDVYLCCGFISEWDIVVV